MRRALLALALGGCGLFASGPVCLSPTDELARGEPPLRCDEAEIASRYVSVIAGRPIRRAERQLVLKDLSVGYAASPAEVRADLAAIAASSDDLASRSGVDAAEARSARAWRDLSASGPFDRYPQAKRALASTVAVWASDDERQLVFTESDIEGWISYASLCREVQAAGPLKLSVAQREGLYRDLRARFRAADRDEQIALVAVGPFWQGFTDAWRAASAERQQGWAAAAPLPPPMTASSLAYAEALLAQPAAPAARVSLEKFGPMALDGSR
jgi:hypothetical protein